VTLAAEVLSQLQRRGISVAADGETLILRPRGALDEALLARIREAKPAILEALRNWGTTCSPECYEVEPGVWIHRPHTGCTTIQPEQEGVQHKVRVTCWHCCGEGKCNCSTCWKNGSGECVACKGTGQVVRWVQ
jgi:hypothetical protein